MKREGGAERKRKRTEEAILPFSTMLRIWIGSSLRRLLAHPRIGSRTDQYLQIAPIWGSFHSLSIVNMCHSSNYFSSIATERK